MPSNEQVAQFWRAVAARNAQRGNNVGAFQDRGRECIEQSARKTEASPSVRRAAFREFEKTTGERPMRFNDEHAVDDQHVQRVAVAVADRLDGAEKPSAVSSASSGRRGLPAGQSWLDGALRAPQRDLEATR